MSYLAKYNKYKKKYIQLIQRGGVELQELMTAIDEKNRLQNELNGKMKDKTIAEYQAKYELKKAILDKMSQVTETYLNSLQDSNYDLEIRLIPLIGYTATPTSKIEVGLDYRLSSFLDQNARHSFWMSLNWFIEI